MNRVTPITLTLSLAVISLAGTAQKVYMAMTRYETYLFNAPVVENQNYHSIKDKITIPNNTLVYCLYRYDTTMSGQPSHMAICVYNDSIGYIPIKSLDLSEGRMIEPTGVFSDSELIAAANEKKAEAMQEGAKVNKDRQKRIKDESARFQKHGLGILTHSFPSDDNTVGFRIGVMNFYKSPIKYIWVTTTIYNPVNDKINSKTVECVGPIDNLKTGFYDFKNVYWTTVFDWGKISKLKVQYMDGRIREFTGETLKELISVKD